MKKYGALIALGLAIIFGAAAVLLTRQYLSERSGPEPVVKKEPVPMGKVVVPSSDIPVGTYLSEENLRAVDWPKKNVPAGSFNTVDELENRVAVTKLFEGRPIIAAEMAAPGSGAGLVAMIEQGKRAMSVRVDEVTGVAGFILPNAMVDVIGVESRGRGETEAETILQRIKVLARSQETYPDEEGKPKVVRTVTLELEPDQAEKLVLQTQEGSIYLVLRNPLEELEKEAPPPEVVEKPEPRRVPTLSPRIRKTRPQPFNVEVYRGTQRDTIEFKDPESGERQ
ncbi:MAG: Flp pilus assembly protein CpaB [Desulfuromonadales bacterium]